MDVFTTGLGTQTWMPFSTIVSRLLVATVLGAIIGFEREWQDRPAGLRTHILVCLAAATVAVLTVEITHAPFFSDEAIRIDPVRLIEAVTAGVAFLAAGTIIFARGEVHGLTTGAGMWLASAVGLCAGLGFWQIAVLATILAVIVLAVLHRFEKRIGHPPGKVFDGDEPAGSHPTDQARKDGHPPGHT